MLRTACALIAGLAVLSGPVQAQSDARAAAREVVKKWQDAVVNVRVVLKTRMSMGGREMQSSDDTVEGIGTVIDPSGLTVLSLGTMNPGAMLTKMMGATGGDQKMEITSEPADLKMRVPDGREVSAKIVLRDEDLDLVFIRPTAKLDKPLVAINLSDGARPALLDSVIVLSRLGRVGGWAAGAGMFDVGAIIERPRTLFVLSVPAAALGAPAFLTTGKIVGLLTLRQIEAGRQSPMSLMGGGMEAMGLLPVILPAADVLEIAKQAQEK